MEKSTGLDHRKQQLINIVKAMPEDTFRKYISLLTICNAVKTTHPYATAEECQGISTSKKRHQIVVKESAQHERTA